MKRFIIGWYLCPLCGKNIRAYKAMSVNGLRGRIIYRPKDCPHCKEEYKVTLTEFWAMTLSKCPDGCLFIMEEANE